MERRHAAPPQAVGAGVPTDAAFTASRDPARVDAARREPPAAALDAPSRDDARRELATPSAASALSARTPRARERARGDVALAARSDRAAVLAHVGLAAARVARTRPSAGGPGAGGASPLAARGAAAAGGRSSWWADLGPDADGAPLRNRPPLRERDPRGERRAATAAPTARDFFHDAQRARTPLAAAARRPTAAAAPRPRPPRAPPRRAPPCPRACRSTACARAQSSRRTSRAAAAPPAARADDARRARVVEQLARCLPPARERAARARARPGPPPGAPPAERGGGARRGAAAARRAARAARRARPPTRSRWRATRARRRAHARPTSAAKISLAGARDLRYNARTTRAWRDPPAQDRDTAAATSRWPNARRPPPRRRLPAPAPRAPCGTSAKFFCVTVYRRPCRRACAGRGDAPAQRRHLLTVEAPLRPPPALQNIPQPRQWPSPAMP